MAFEAMRISRSSTRIWFRWEQKEQKNGILGKPHFQGELSKMTKAKGLTEQPEQLLKIRSIQKSG